MQRERGFVYCRASSPEKENLQKYWKFCLDKKENEVSFIIDSSINFKPITKEAGSSKPELKF